MLVQLSTTSPYLCDISLGPIEQANRMASAPTKKLLPYLDLKESFPRLLQPTRTPLKLLAPEEVPMDSSAATDDNNTSRQPSLQPIWYTEQTILDEQQRNSSKSPGHRLDLTRSTLPTIESHSPENESLSNRPLLMRKSSTFTIEQQPSILNDSEKENDYSAIITSTQKEPTHVIHHPREPSDESFRALEHLLGLGSTNLTMTTLAHESPKSNHESLSLTIVTPTELINQTTNSLHLSYAPAGGGSLPSSQNILLMPTIESITEPSMNSTVPPPFLVDNSDIEEPSSMGGTVLNQENSRLTEEEDSFGDTDDERQDTPEDESNFSFELHDFPNNSTSEPLPPPPPPPAITFRAPTSADVAYRALIKPRAGGRSSQPLRMQSPLAKSTARSSVPAVVSRTLRSSSRRLSVDPVSQESTIAETEPDNTCVLPELVEVVSAPDEDELESEQTAGITLNLTETKEINVVSPNSAEEADCSASSSASYMSTPQDIPTPTDTKLPVLSREYTFNTPTGRVTRSSERRRSLLTTRPSYSRLTHSLIPTIPEQQTTTTTTEEEEDVSSTTVDEASIYSIPSSSKTILSMLSTNPTAISEAPPIVLQKSLAGSASPSPNPTPIITIRRSDCLSLNSSPRRSINPLHSSTPSNRNKPLQIVSIGEDEQVSTTAPQQLNIDVTTEEIDMIDNEQQIDIPIRILHLADEGIQTSPEKPSRGIDISVQTTPSLDPSSRRRFQTIEQQTSPIVPRSSSSSSCQTSPIAVTIQRSSTQQTSPLSKVISTEPIQPQVTPLHSKALMHLRRNVRFQFTPSTDARLAAKEKSEEQEQQHSKQEIVIHTHPTPILSDNEREEDTEDDMKKSTKTKKKITASKKKKTVSTVKTDESSEEMIESPVPRHQPPHEQPKATEPEVPPSKVAKKKTPKPSTHLEEKSEVLITTKPPTRKRPDTTSSTEPVAKKAKILEVKEPIRAPSPDPPSTRNRSKTSIITSKSASPPPTSKKAKKTSLETNVVENPPSIPTSNKRKNPATTTTKKSKRRLHSVEQDEGLNTADEEEEVIPSVDFNGEEREKIEGLTVAELKARLTTHHESIPKGARKADLVALLIKIQTHPPKEHKQVVESPARKTRRKK